MAARRRLRARPLNRPWASIPSTAPGTSRQQGQERLACLVAYHSGARFEAEERGLVDALAEFEPEDGPLLDALTYADMTTGPAGQRVDLEERIAEIAERYGAEHLVVHCLKRAHDHLAGAVRAHRGAPAGRRPAR